MVDPFDELAFQSLADAHPHEMNKHDPVRFWRYFHGREPTVSKSNMLKLLKETWNERKLPERTA